MDYDGSGSDFEEGYSAGWDTGYGEGYRAGRQSLECEISDLEYALAQANDRIESLIQNMESI